MSLDKLLHIADIIETYGDEVYDQRSYGHQSSCGTVACIAGLLCAEEGWYPTLNDFGSFTWNRINKNPLRGAWSDPTSCSPHYVARDILEINNDEADVLFGTYFLDGDVDRAPNVLRDIARGNSRILDYEDPDYED